MSSIKIQLPELPIWFPAVVVSLYAKIGRVGDTAPIRVLAVDGVDDVSVDDAVSVPTEDSIAGKQSITTRDLLIRCARWFSGNVRGCWNVKDRGSNPGQSRNLDPDVWPMCSPAPHLEDWDHNIGYQSQLRTCIRRPTYPNLDR